MGIPLNIQCYAPGAGGVFSTAYPLPDLKDRVDGYQHSISDHYGFESCTMSMHVALAEAMDWLRNGLMRSLVVTGPAGEICWEGFLETVTVTVGQKKASLSLKNMANSVYFLWTTVEGTPGNIPSTPTTASQLSQALYGRKDYLGALPNALSSTVAAAAARILALLCFPRSAESTTAQTGGIGEITLELSFAGWYATLDWLLVSNNSVALTATSTQLTATYLPGYATINAFLSTDYSGIAFTGPSMPAYVPNFSTYGQVIKRLLSVGDTSNRTLTYGVFENRTFLVAPSAANTPTVLTYQEDAGTGIILDAYGNVVKPWNVRPNAMSQVVQLLDTTPVTGATDSAAVKYVSRVVCGIQGDNIGCELEPSGAGGIDAILAAFPNPGWKGF